MSVRYDKLTNASEADYSDIINLTNVLNNAPDATYIQDVSAVLNVDQWVKWFALARDACPTTRPTSATVLATTTRCIAASPIRGSSCLPHDLDTIIGQGDSPGGTNDSIFRATDGVVTAMNRFLLAPANPAEVLPNAKGFDRNDLLGGQFRRPVGKCAGRIRPASDDRRDEVVSANAERLYSCPKSRKRSRSPARCPSSAAFRRRRLPPRRRSRERPTRSSLKKCSSMASRQVGTRAPAPGR